MIDSRRQTSHSESNEGSPLLPFRHRLFVWIWVGNAVSALGTWIQATASAWVMTDLAPNPLMVSIVQAASQLPILMLAIPAGALADIVDRRRLLLWTNLGMLAASGALAVFQALGLISVWTLLGLTMLLAAFSALNDPAWAASVPTTVPRRALTQALILNSIGFNVARSIGPAIGGLIVAVLGAAAAFAANAASFAIVAILIGAFLALPRTPHIQGVPPESMVPAVRVGLRYAMAEPVVRVALVRSGAFYLFASAIWALLPLYVRDILALSSASYGLMLGAIGVGAVLGGVLMPLLRHRVSRDSCVMLAGLLTSGALIPVALLKTPSAVTASMIVYGIGWIIGTTNLQATVQLACAPWVRARGLALYQAVFNGGMGFGAVAWGWLGTYSGLPGTLLAAGLGGIVMALVARLQALPNEVADPSLPAVRLPPTVNVHEALAPALDASKHPVLVTISYSIDPEDAHAFRAAMKELAAARRRTGAIAWLLTRDVEQPRTWVEAFRVQDWHELRRGMVRINLADSKATEKVHSFHRGVAPPEARVLIAEDR